MLVERQVRWPLVDLSLFRNGRFTILVLAGTVANIAYAVTIYLSTVNLQQVRGLDPLTAGLAFLGPSVGAALGGPLSGRLAAKYPPVRVMGAASVAAAVSLAALAVSNGWVLYLIALSGVRIHHGTRVRVHHRRDSGGRAARARGRGGRGGADVIGDAGRRRCRGVRHDARGAAHARACRRARASRSSSLRSPRRCCPPLSPCWPSGAADTT